MFLKNRNISSKIKRSKVTDYAALTTTECRAKIWRDSNAFKPPPSHTPLAWAAVRSKAVVLLLLIYCFMYLPLFVGVLCWSLFWYVLLYIHSSFVIILTRKREQGALPLLSFGCLVTVNAL